MRETGLDLAHFRSIDAYIPLSVEVSLSKFMEGGEPDAERFAAFVGPTIERAQRGGRSVRVFRETLGILLARRQFAASIHLEQLWNRLLEREPIRLLCAYPRGSIARANPHSVGQVDASHSAVSRG